jgi:hypothetical protein
MALQPIASLPILFAVLVGAWTWPPSARVLRGGFENNLGYLYLHGILVTQDSRKALAWYTRAAERRLPTATYNLAYIYQTGNGAVPNPRARPHAGTSTRRRSGVRDRPTTLR